MPDNLPELRDIHIPHDLPSFPLGYGWSVIIAVCVLSFLTYKFIRFVVSKSKKRYALNLLKNIASDNVQKSASAMSEILRRVCVYKYPEALVLTGKDWSEFLRKHSKAKLDDKTAELLINAPYMPSNTKSYDMDVLQNLKTFCLKWIGENL